jgi:hypothetical protein
MSLDGTGAAPDVCNCMPAVGEADAASQAHPLVRRSLRADLDGTPLSSPLRAHADIVLHTMAKETRFRTEAMTSRIAQLAIVDALIASLALATYDRSVDIIAKTFDVLSTKRF